MERFLFLKTLKFVLYCCNKNKKLYLGLKPKQDSETLLEEPSEDTNNERNFFTRGSIVVLRNPDNCNEQISLNWFIFYLLLFLIAFLAEEAKNKLKSLRMYWTVITLLGSLFSIFHVICEFNPNYIKCKKVTPLQKQREQCAISKLHIFFFQNLEHHLFGCLHIRFCGYIHTEERDSLHCFHVIHNPQHCHHFPLSCSNPNSPHKCCYPL